MCGIAGYVTAGPAQEAYLAAVLDRQTARGPDDRGTWSWRGRGRSVGLGHNRLSILDLSARGHQPMESPDGELVVAFNGEVYNYRELREQLAADWQFRTGTDTEVILAAFSRWGTAAWDRFNGMFSLALVDLRSEELFLVRSRMGSKPLYYASRGADLMFASRADALARGAGAGLDVEYLGTAIVTGVFDGPGVKTPFLGVRSLPPGVQLSLDLADPQSRPRMRRWYSLAESVGGVGRSRAGVRDNAHRLRELMADSVRLRLRSDVPLGASLSGGLDSTTVLALAARESEQPVDAYVYRWGVQDPDANSARAFASAMGPGVVRLHWVDPPSSRGDAVGAIEKTFADQGAPVPGLSIVAQNMVFARAASDGLKVMLGGQGSDEVLMGYASYHSAALRAAVDTRNPLGLLRSAWDNGRYWSADLHTFRAYLGEHRANTAGAGAQAILPADGAGLELNLRNPTALSLANVGLRNLPNLLRYEDTNSMGSSIESRLPFLDYRIAEFALRLPTSQKVRNGYGKWLLRCAMSADLPSHVCWTRWKRGFEPGMKRWLSLGVGEWIRSIVADGSRQLQDAGVPVRADDVASRYSDALLERDEGVLAEALVLAWAARWESRRP